MNSPPHMGAIIPDGNGACPSPRKVSFHRNWVIPWAIRTPPELWNQSWDNNQTDLSPPQLAHKDWRYSLWRGQREASHQVVPTSSYPSSTLPYVITLPNKSAYSLHLHILKLLFVHDKSPRTFHTAWLEISPPLWRLSVGPNWWQYQAHMAVSVSHYPWY